MRSKDDDICGFDRRECRIVQRPVMGLARGKEGSTISMVVSEAGSDRLTGRFWWAERRPTQMLYIRDVAAVLLDDKQLLNNNNAN